MKVVNLTIVKLSCCLVLGIITAHFFPSETLLLLPLLGGCFVLFLLWLKGRSQLRPSIFFGITALFLFFGIGFVNYQLRLPRHIANHYTHFAPTETPQLLQLKVIEQLKPDLYNFKFLASVQRVGKQKTSGTILMYVEKDSTLKVKLDDLLFVYGEIKPIPKMLNPHQFDYQSYMQTQHVYAEVRCSKKQRIRKINGATSIRGKAEHLRNHAIKKIKETNLPLDERAILQALVLGQKRDLSSQLKQKYADAGAIHILAVSGLHVGILFLILSFLSSPIKRLRHGSIYQSIIVLIGLWCFAFITGLSPSVSRAVTMFSFLALAQTLGRQTYTMNTLFLSFLFLLLLEPFWLFHVGFQLSYLAVFFIVWVQPKFTEIWRPRNRFIRLIWGIITVSIAAQLGVLPLSVYYFHQVPGLFLLTNIVILPLLGMILGMGLLYILWACTLRLPAPIVEVYSMILQQLNYFVSWVAAQDQFIIKNLSFSEWQTAIFYLLIVTLILIWNKATYSRILLLLGIIWINAVLSGFIFNTLRHTELVIFQKNRSTLIGIVADDEMILMKNDSAVQKKKYPIQKYALTKKLKHIKEQPIPSIFKYNGQTFLVLDSLGVYPKGRMIDFVILANSPRVHLERLIKDIKPQIIIADGSNYYSYVNRWKKTCQKEGIPFYYTKESGAYMINKNPNK